uniref:SOSS complex subunit A homolog n=1 Tax=Steinernema glaseri TaxID=37863 RepID=A0A1I7YXW2_9BILA
MDPASRNGRRESRLFITNLKYECYNEMEEQFERHYGVVMTKINGFSEKEATENILALSNMDKTSFESCCAGLVYAFIVDTDKEKTAKHFKLLACIAANEAQPWWTVLCVTNMILIELMHRVKTPLRSRMVTFFAHLMKDPNCKKVDSVMTNFLRFIGTDCCDITESLELLSMLIQLLLSNFDWMKQLKINSTLPTASFLNVVRYLSSPTLGKELDPYKPLFLNFVERVVRERFAWLTLLGRWVLFDLMKLSSYPSISAIWSDIYNNPTHICSDMPGGVVDMMTKTNPLVFTQRLPNLLQRRVEAIWRFPPSSDFEYHFQWINETLAAPSCTGLRAELIRVMPQLAVCDKDSFYVRTVFTAFILSTAEAHEQAMCRLAFFIDWICCVREPSAQSTDLIIATLSYSSQHNPQLVNSLFDFLVLVDSFVP